NDVEREAVFELIETVGLEIGDLVMTERAGEHEGVGCSPTTGQDIITRSAIEHIRAVRAVNEIIAGTSMDFIIQAGPTTVIVAACDLTGDDLFADRRLGPDGSVGKPDLLDGKFVAAELIDQEHRVVALPDRQ